MSVRVRRRTKSRRDPSPGGARDRPVVIATLIGGLGNQLFQYAAARALADRRGSPLQLDVGWLRRPHGVVTPRRYELEGLSVRGEVVCVYGWSPFVRYKELLGIAPRPVRETTMTFTSEVLHLRGDVRLVGYWMSERYFADQADRIRADLQLRASPSVRNEALLSAIAGTTSISVHVRRGDYVSDEKVATRHGALPPDYYREAVRRILQVAPGAECFVFSDDLAWCRAHLTLDARTTFVDGNGDCPGEDIRLMALCNHHVIANSSFSWWGAWLNPRQAKMVVAPRRWFAAEPEPPDLIPPGWMRL